MIRSLSRAQPLTRPSRHRAPQRAPLKTFAQHRTLLPGMEASTARNTAPDCAAHAAARFGLAGRNVLVTGGTKGIGAAVVAELAALGARVFTCARSAADVDAAVASWRGTGLDVTGCAADVSDEAQRKRLVEEVRTEGAAIRRHPLQP